MRSASDQYYDESDEPRISSSKPKKHADKNRHKVRSRYVSSSSEEDQSSATRHRSSKPSGALSDQDQPQHDPDPPYYREVAASDVPSQYAEEVDSVLVDQIMQACHWKAHNTFTIFYLKDLTWSDNDTNMYLGPVVAAQQVLDPSPQTSYPRKEKKGGGAHPLQPSLQEPNPRI